MAKGESMYLSKVGRVIDMTPKVISPNESIVIHAENDRNINR